ncbi:hypothetical protein CHS0354_024352 [Potamilus streckersoni]|uniref:Uncharacterized protein n=1 Tax=Potamilus streckersoni TaxID=2493646 RepID=A0AAE0TIJ0_9BIVA|nr:hypothetical protein CHS0354_024352 [Potamilus streckersoni]
MNFARDAKGVKSAKVVLVMLFMDLAKEEALDAVFDMMGTKLAKKGVISGGLTSLGYGLGFDMMAMDSAKEALIELLAVVELGLKKKNHFQQSLVLGSCNSYGSFGFGHGGILSSILSYDGCGHKQTGVINKGLGCSIYGLGTGLVNAAVGYSEYGFRREGVFSIGNGYGAYVFEDGGKG